MDTHLLFYFLQKSGAKKIIEIDSGNSTLLTYNTKQMFNLYLDIICIKPYPCEMLIKLHNTGKIILISNYLLIQVWSQN